MVRNVRLPATLALGARVPRTGVLVARKGEDTALLVEAGLIDHADQVAHARDRLPDLAPHARVLTSANGELPAAELLATLETCLFDSGRPVLIAPEDLLTVRSSALLLGPLVTGTLHGVPAFAVDTGTLRVWTCAH